jgi:hypothetical protein
MKCTWALAPLLLLLASSEAFAQDDSAVTTAFEIASQGVDAFEQGNSTTESVTTKSRSEPATKPSKSANSCWLECRG